MARKRKAIGTHSDSNKYRSKQKELIAEEIKLNLSDSDLMKVPSNFFVRDRKLYDSLVKQLEKLKVAHLSELDIFSLVSCSNTISLINEAEQLISEQGMQQKLQLREGGEKLIPNPMLAQRNTLLNTLNSQFKELLLSPDQRRELLSGIQNDLTNLNDDGDDELIKQLLMGAK